MAFAPPTLDQAQSALVDALEPLSTGKINAPKEIWALEVLQLFAVSKALNIPDTGVVSTLENQVELSDADMLHLLKEWDRTGNVNAEVPNPINPSSVATINWGQLIQMILPLLLNELLKRLGK